MSHDDQGQAGASAPGGIVSPFVKRRKDVCGFPKHPPKVSIPVQQDQDHELGRMDVITEPTSASRPEALQAKTSFSQDRMYLLSPFKFGRCGIPSRHCDKGRGPGPLL